jgi:uncharacterized protein YjbI with pentapeptide repeats
VPVPDPEDGWSDLELRSEDLVGADLFKLRATGSKLVACELSGASLARADLWRVEVRDCRLSGAVLDGARLRDVAFVGCKLDTASMREIEAERVTFTDCVLREADLSRSSWQASAFFDCDLTGTIVAESRMAGVRFHGSSIERVVGADALRGVVVAPDQTLNLGLRVLDAMGVTVDEERDATTTPSKKKG